MSPFLKLYEQVCQSLETQLQARLGRPLEDTERLGIWNAGSLMMLESIERSLALIDDPDQLIQELHALTRLFERNLIEHRRNALEYYAAQSQCPPSIETALQTAPTVYDVLRLMK